MGDISDTAPRGAKLRWNLAGIAAGLGILILVFSISGASLSGILTSLQKVSWVTYVAAGLSLALIVVLAAWKWKIVLDETLDGQSLPLGLATSATATGALLGQIISIQVSVPIVRAWIARRRGIGVHAAVGTSLFEQMLELVTLGFAAIASVVLIATSGSIWVALAALGALCICGTLAIRPTLALGATILNWLPAPTILAGGKDRLSTGLKLMSDQRASALGLLMAISLFRYAAITALNVGIMIAIAPSIDPMPLIIAFPIILLAASLPFLPAGLGAAELSWVGALVLQGIDPAQATEMAITLRVVSLAAYFGVYPFLYMAGHIGTPGSDTKS